MVIRDVTPCSLLVPPRKWRQQVPSKCLYPSTKLYTITSKKVIILIILGSSEYQVNRNCIKIKESLASLFVFVTPWMISPCEKLAEEHPGRGYGQLCVSQCLL